MTPSADEPLRDDHAELLRRRALTEDAARPDAISADMRRNGRTARENVADLVDPDSFVEYAASPCRERFPVTSTTSSRATPADGLVRAPPASTAPMRRAGLRLHGAFAGTQGALGHRRRTGCST